MSVKPTAVLAATSAASAAGGGKTDGRRDVLQLIKALKQNVRNGAACREAILTLHTRIFDDAASSRENFTRFILNSNGGVAALLATLENHSGDPAYLELSLVFLCNLMHYGGRRNLRVVNKVVKKGGSRICLSILNKHSSNMRVVHPATMAVIALATTDSKILVTARLNGTLTTLLGLVRGYASLPRDGLASVLSCLCSLSRGEGNLVQLGKKGAVVVLMEVCAKNLRTANSPALRWVLKVLVQLCAHDDNAKEIAREGGVTVGLHALYEQGGSVEIQKTVLDLMKLLLRFPEGLQQFTAAGGYEYVVNVLLENNADKQDDALLDLVVQLYKFFGVVELPVGNDNDLSWAPPPVTDGEGDDGERTPSVAVDGADDSSAAGGDTGSEAAGPTPVTASPPSWVGSRFSPELLDGAVDPETALPESIVVHHVKPFRDPRPSPSCQSSIDFVPPIEELLVQAPSQRSDVIRQEMRRLVTPSAVINRVVFDDLPRSTSLPPTQLSSAASGQPTIPVLKFGSGFESGNLKRAIQVFDTEYDLILSNDVNTGSYCQWFYFSVENMRSDVTYKFNIINMEKPGSSFDDGQRPILFSERRFTWSGLGWLRTGHSIAYLKNSYRRRVTKRKSKGAAGEGGNSYYTLTFSVRFPHDEDRAYLANAYPFTYSDMIQHLRRKIADAKERGLSDLMVQSLCNSQSGNPTPVVTITSLSKGGTPCSPDEIRRRQVVVISARVHPGETGASYCCKGLIDYLLDNTEQAQWMRENMVWKIVPMLNPDGVINGNHRCALSGKDLNREFLRPSPQHAPTIFYLKELIKQVKFCEGRAVMLYGDFHGHSRRDNFFVYSCGAQKKLEVHGLVVERVFPRLMSELCPYFAYSGSSFKVQKSKETTGRVVFYRQLGIRMSYTLEGSMMGGDACDFLPVSWDDVSEDVSRRAARARKTRAHFNTGHYAAMGAMFAKTASVVCQAITGNGGRAGDLVHEMLTEISSSSSKGPGTAASPASATSGATPPTMPVSGARPGAAGASQQQPQRASLPGSPLTAAEAAGSEFDGDTMTGTYASNRRGSVRATAKGAALRRINPVVTAADVNDVLATMTKGLPIKGKGKAARGATGAGAACDGSGGDDDFDDDQDADEDEDISSETSGESSVEDDDAGGAGSGDDDGGDEE